jgi:hypothetical protein
MSEGSIPLTRRRTDGDGQDDARPAHRVVAERAYQLFLEGGSDRTRTLECWARAEQELSDSHLSK